MTSALQEKQTDVFDVVVPKDTDNALYQTSRARIRQMRSVSIKRLGKCVGTIANEAVKSAINKAVKEMIDFET